ncbi:MAG: endonuclease MutS2 [Prochlorothrix sp.]|nr:endonuclease MutS2 [Prochlorothrix sp.]
MSSVSVSTIQTETLDLLEWPRLCQHLSTFAATQLGKHAAQQVPIPRHLDQSRRLLAQTQEVYDLEAKSGSLPFEGIRDIGESLERAGRGGVLNGDELLSIATTLAGMRTLRRLIDAQDEEQVPQLLALVAELRTYPELERQIHHCIDDRGRVTDRASETLGQIRAKLKGLRDEIYQTLQRIIQRQGAAIQEQVITQREGRYVIPVKAPQKDAVPGIVHDSSASGATLYIEPKVIFDRNNRLRQLQRQEQAEEERVCQQLSGAVAEVQEDLERLLAIGTALDLATARARYSDWIGGNRPRFIDSTVETMTLRQLRHPLLEWQQRREQGTAVVPIDLQIQPQTRVVAITGPNTGGKTVTLKTLGLAVLMAKVGLFIPAREPVELPWLGQVLADIGDEQSIQQSLSTFSGHIRRITRILDVLEPAEGPAAQSTAPREPGIGEITASPRTAAGNGQETADRIPDRIQEVGLNSHAPQEVATNPQETEDLPLKPALSPTLVLLDEVGAGTDPSEGSALAIALLKSLADRAQLTIATTHFGELKALKYEDDRFENASVEFNDVTLSPTYRLLWGIPGRSNALAIAQRLGLEAEVIDRARQHLMPGSSTAVNEVIAGLEAQRRRQEDKAQEAAQLLAQTEKLHREVNRKSEQMRAWERELKQKQEQEVQVAIAAAKADIAQVIRTLQQGTPTAQKAQKATAKLEQLAQDRLPSQQPKPLVPKGFQPKVGDRIRVTSLGHVAEVLTLPDSSGELTVRFGLMKMNVSLGDIESLQGEKALIPEKSTLDPIRDPKTEAHRNPKATSKRGAPAQPESSLAPAIRTSRNTLDLRGSRVADAEIELDRAIAEAEGPLWVIHGHGTGKLRRGVQEFLKTHRGVDRFEAADKTDGGTGVTVVYPRL